MFIRRRRKRRRSPRKRRKLQLEGLTARELGAKVGVTARTVRFYTTERLLPSTTFRGTATRYLRPHLVHLAAVRQLQRVTSLSLAGIRKKLDTTPADEIEKLAAAFLPELAPPAPPSPAAPSLPQLPLDTWYRLTVVPGLEIHCHATASTEVRALARSLADSARGRA